MNKLVFREFYPSDLDDIELHDAFKDDPGVKDRFMHVVLSLGPKFVLTLLDPEEKPLALLSAIPIYEKVYELTSIVDKRVDQCGLHYGRAMKFLIDHEFKGRQLNRMQIVVRADMPWASKWPAFLGFSFEARMRQYGEEGVDHFLFAKVRE